MRKVFEEVIGFIGAFVIYYGLVIIALIPAELFLNGNVDLSYINLRYIICYGIMALVLTVGSEICRFITNRRKTGKWFEY